MGSGRIWISVASIAVIIALTVFLYGYNYFPLVHTKLDQDEQDKHRDLVFGDYSKLFWGL